MSEAEGSTPSGTGPTAVTSSSRISKMAFRMYLRKLLDRRTMLSSMTGAAEIDTIFPMLDKNGDGTIEIEELQRALVELEESLVASRHSCSLCIAREINHQFVDRARATLVKVEGGGSVEGTLRQRARRGRVLAVYCWSRMRHAPRSPLFGRENDSVDKAGFRKASQSMGLGYGASEIDSLFDSAADIH